MGLGARGCTSSCARSAAPRSCVAGRGGHGELAVASRSLAGRVGLEVARLLRSPPVERSARWLVARRLLRSMSGIAASTASCRRVTGCTPESSLTRRSGRNRNGAKSMPADRGTAITLRVRPVPARLGRCLPERATKDENGSGGRRS